MSQAGIVDVEGAHPQIPTSFVTNSGTAIPIGNTLELLGTIVAAHSIPLETTGSGNTVTIASQYSSSAASSVGTNAGMASFSSNNFIVDANGFVTLSGSGAGETITGNSGGALSPTAGNWNILGTGSITTSGAGSTLTAQLTGLTNHAVLVGAGTATITKVGPTATSGQVLQSQGSSSDPAFSTATYPSTTTISQILYSSSNNVVGGITAANSAVLVSNSTGVPAWSGSMTNGQVIIGSTGATPSASTLTAGTGISITNGANSITIAVSGSVVGETITGNSGGALSPTAGNWNILGTGSTTTSGSGSTLTVQLTGLTNHALQIGAGTATLTQLGAGTTGQVLQTNTSADPTWSTATYPSTTTINQILYSSSANVVGGLATANNGVLTTGTSGIPVITALASNGQLIIGSGSGAPAAATLSAGTGITITNGANSITIANTNASGFPWTDVTGATQTLAVNNGYVTDHSTTVTYTLPSTAALGDTIKIVGKLGLATITPNSNQQILIGSASGTVGATGTAVSNNVGDCITLICITAGSSTVWRADSVVGTWTLN